MFTRACGGGLGSRRQRPGFGFHVSLFQPHLEPDNGAVVELGYDGQERYLRPRASLRERERERDKNVERN